MVPKLSMVPHPSSAVQIGTFIGHSRHLRGSPVNKRSVEKENGGGKGTMDKSCGGGVNGFGVSLQQVEMELFPKTLGIPILASCAATRFGKQRSRTSLGRTPSGDQINPERFCFGETLSSAFRQQWFRNAKAIAGDLKKTPWEIPRDFDLRSKAICDM